MGPMRVTALNLLPKVILRRQSTALKMCLDLKVSCALTLLIDRIPPFFFAKVFRSRLPPRTLRARSRTPKQSMWGFHYLLIGATVKDADELLSPPDREAVSDPRS